MKKNTILMMGLTLSLILVSCSENSSPQTSNDSTPTQTTEATNNTATTENTAENAVTSSNQEDFFWQIEILSAERTTDLSNTQSFTLYGGDIEDVDYSASASEGQEFLILELSIDKAGAGGSPFDWADLSVKDSLGNQYVRMENDKFLEDYNLPRLNGTALTLGNEGFVCVEISSGAEGLNLVHSTEDGENILSIFG